MVVNCRCQNNIYFTRVRFLAGPINLPLYNFKSCVTLASKRKVESKQETGKNIFAPFLINCFGAPGVPGQGCSSREAERANVVPYNRSWCGAFKPDGRTVGLGGTIVRAASTAWLLNSFPPLETELPPLVRSCQVQSPSDFSKRPLACCP